MKGLLKNTLVYALADFIFKFIGFAVFPLYANALTVSEFGKISLLTTLATLLSILCNCGQEQALHRFYLDSELPVEKKPVIAASGLINLLLFSFLGLAAASITLLGLNSSLVEMELSWPELLLAILWSLPLQIVNYMQAVLRAAFQKWKFSLFLAVQNSLMVGCTLYLTIGRGGGVPGYMLASFMASSIAAGFGLFLVRREIVWKIDRKAIFGMAGYGYPFIFSGVAFWVFGSMDRWMIEELSDSYQVGLYSIAFKVGSVLTFLVYAFNGAWTPYALKITSNESEYRSIYSRSFTVWFFLMILASGALALFGQEVLLFLTPEEYWSASDLLPSICFGICLYGTTAVTSIGIVLSKKTQFISLASCIAALVNFLLNWFLIPAFGAMGAAAVTLFCNGLMTSLYFVFSQRFHPIPVEKERVFFCLAAFGILYASSICLLSLPWRWEILIIKASLLALIFSVGCWLKIFRFNSTFYIFGSLFGGKLPTAK